MEHWLRMLPEEQIQGSPLLLASRAWTSQARGQLKELPRLLTAAEQLLASSDRESSDADDTPFRLLRGLIATLWSLYYFFTGQIQASMESARSALALIPPGEMHMASHTLQFVAWSYQAAGHEEVALAAVQQALQDQSTGLSSYCATTLRAGVRVSGDGQTSSRRTHRAPFVAHLP